jgi:hypothetical protein
MKYFDQKARRFIADYTKANYEQISVEPGECRFNLMCHMNAVHEAIDDNEKEIALCIYFIKCYKPNQIQPIIHFVNVTETEALRYGYYTDNTIGHFCVNYKYYIVRYIDKADFMNIDNVFANFRKELRSKLPWWLRLLSKVNF